jgi:hypothetical protein
VTSKAMPEPETAALNLTCAECGRSHRAIETWRVLFANIGEAVTYCPEVLSGSSESQTAS